ncbi:HigA family addiction module antitoxin [Acidithiobacillus sp.]|uniref:HigA family addiction module antitoxin n=1 Tax=Acidithiobacillus sp. TaxID=1872118 RepID=UPI0025BC770D|nr:HigA family addiction module antitoxin [Acidithiobacillus sp.]
MGKPSQHTHRATLRRATFDINRGIRGKTGLRFCASWHTIETMDENAEEYRIPGQLIKALLMERGWSNRVLAAVIDIEETGISKLVSGKKSVTPEIAIALEEVFGIEADKFLSLQKQYDLAKARLVARPNPKRATRAHLFSGLPVAEMIKRRWIETEDVRDMPSVEHSIAKFFGVESIDQVEILPHAAKRTVVSDSATPTQLAWLYRVKQISSEMFVGQCSKSSILHAIELLKPLTLSAEEARKVPRVLAECGIRFVIVESLSSAKIDGVCFWLDEKSPVIGMSMRFDRIDNFWFVLRHELEHALQEHGKSVIAIDSELEGSRAGIGDSVIEEERIANQAAADFCVPQKTMDSFIARKAPVFSERDILGLAATLRVHPGLVAGQLRNRIGRYDRFNNHLVKMREIIFPSAVVDGWGNVAPVGNF